MRHLSLVLLGMCLLSSASAQDLHIINARIIDGAGLRLDDGSILIRDGRIEAVTSAPIATNGVPMLDVNGMTIMPAFIDAHRHVIRGDTEAWFNDQAELRMREFLDAGFTTLMSGGGPVPGIIELQRRVEAGEIVGPRIVTSGRADPPDFESPQHARERVQQLADLGVDIIKARIAVEDQDMLSVVTEEAHRHGLDVMVHAVTVPAMHAAIDAGADKFVHTPHGSFMSPTDAKRVAAGGIENLSTIGFAVPVFGVFNDDNVPTFRDGSPWPEGILGTGSNAAGEKAVNARTLWDAGVVYGFGTDTSYHPRDGLAHELRALNLMFSSQDIIKLMGPNTAAFLDMEDALGTIEPGKIADLVVVDGDPLSLIFELLDVAIVIKEGEIVTDHRTSNGG